MLLKQYSLFDGTPEDLELKSIKLIKEFEEASLYRNPVGYVVGYSGGKDSDVLVHLFIKSGVKFIIIHHHTTLDAPETVYYIRKKFKEWRKMGIDCRVYYPEKSFWGLCKKKLMLPTRFMRFCCSELKERDIPELKFATHSFGVRKAESVKRTKYRDSVEIRDKSDYSDNQNYHWDNTEEIRETGACYTKQYFIVNPIAYWSDSYLWQYIEEEKIEINPLYAKGYTRIGCVGCPMSNKRVCEFERNPKYKQNMIKTCDYIIKTRNEKGLPNFHNFQTGQEYFDWWIKG